jgi:hypothetical protein
MDSNFVSRQIVTTAFLLTVLLSDAFALETERPEKTRSDYIRLDVAYIFGAQIYNDNFLYNPGFNVYGIYGTSVNERVNVGLGTGVQLFQNETFIPVFIDLTGFIDKKKNTRLLSLQCGYSFAWSNALRNLRNSRLNGGIYLNAGFARKFFIDENFSIIPSISYRHQFAQIEYEVFNLEQYCEKINYDMLVVGISFLF